jgi:predicted metal-dependent hydrolase
MPEPSWWQLTLDWLGFESPAAPDSAPAPELKKTSYRHPKANRVLVWNGVEIAYCFLRAKRRSIGFVIHPEGLVVRAPNWVTVSQVEAALYERVSWILEKLQQAQSRQSEALLQQTPWADGTVFPLHGRSIVLRCGPLGQGVGRGWPTWSVVLTTGELVLPAGWQRKSTTGSQDVIKAAVLAWIRAEAHGFFVSRLEHFAPQLAVRWTRLSLSQARTRWGSARQDGAIRLNWRLMHLEPELIDYVVVHELSHLRVMDHSPLFWRTVAGVLPDVQNLRRRLRECSVP